VGALGGEVSDRHGEAPELGRLVNHVGITVSDLEASAAFYRDVVGMEIVRCGTKPTGGEWFDTLTDSRGAVINGIVLAAEGFALQLVQYFEGGEQRPMTGHSRVGNVHLCINVDGLDQKHAEIVASGKWNPTPIVDLPIPGQRSFYVRDPDGVPIEFSCGPYVAERTGVPPDA
jgi:catechol 2,3-dioxygenase-like lactoylglutathione lyase family enzyme